VLSPPPSYGLRSTASVRTSLHQVVRMVCRSNQRALRHEALRKRNACLDYLFLLRHLVAPFASSHSCYIGLSLRGAGPSLESDPNPSAAHGVRNSDYPSLTVSTNSSVFPNGMRTLDHVRRWAQGPLLASGPHTLPPFNPYLVHLKGLKAWHIRKAPIPHGRRKWSSRRLCQTFNPP
jgi:hypothetical protein